MYIYFATVKYMLNILLLGDSRVGKSSFMYRLTNKTFSPSYIATIGLGLGEYESVIVHDTAGDDRFKTLQSVYYRHADGALIIFDVTDKRTEDSVAAYREEILNVSCQKIPVMVLGNKIDLLETPPSKEGVSYISCKSGENVVESIQKFIPLLTENPKTSVQFSDRLLSLLQVCVQQ
jgi:small GTP-binding protein